MSKETEVQELISTISSQIFESKKRISNLRIKLLDEETSLVGLQFRLDLQKELLRRHLNSAIFNEIEERNSQIDSAFRDKLDSLLASVK